MAVSHTELWAAVQAAKYPLEFDHVKSSSQPATKQNKAQAPTQVVIENNFAVTKEKVNYWLDSVGLKVNPFDVIDASLDPFIPFYLIDHDQYRSVNGDFASYVFAPPGSGKSAFRVRLARDCRIGKNGRKIFPIVYNLPPPGYPAISPDTHYAEIARAAAFELMLFLVYHVSAVIKDELLLSKFQQVFDSNFPINYIQQMVDGGGIQPLLDSFDQTARLLPNPPEKKDIVLLAEKLKSIRHPVNPIQRLSDKQRFEHVISLVVDILGYEAIYVLIDGVDGYLETGGNADKAVDAISWLVTKSGEWQTRKIYMKYFLPVETHEVLLQKFPLLTSEGKITIIEWNADTLSEVIRQRLQEASGGKYNSLRALSSLPLRGARLTPEEKLAQEVMKLGNPTPRKMIQAVRVLLHYHVQENEHEKLTPEDLKAAIDWLHKRSIKPRHA